MLSIGVITEGSYTDPNVLTFPKMNLSLFSDHFSFRADSIIPFFCGDSELCRTLGSEEALSAAKINIRNKVRMRRRSKLQTEHRNCRFYNGSKN